MPIIRRISRKKKQEPPRPKYRVPPKGKYLDNVEEYVFGLPHEPIRYTEMVTEWVLPYQENSFILFGVKLRLTPIYNHRGDNLVQITGLLAEIRIKNKKQKIVGPRGTWHGLIKYFAKANATEQPK